jgi:uncharacterized protein (DUF3084 family)
MKNDLVVLRKRLENLLKKKDKILHGGSNVKKDKKVALDKINQIEELRRILERKSKEIMEKEAEMGERRRELERQNEELERRWKSLRTMELRVVGVEEEVICWEKRLGEANSEVRSLLEERDQWKQSG